MLKKGMTVAALISAGFILASCAEPGQSEAPATDGESGENTVTLTLYTSEPEEKVDEINAAFEQENPGIDVDVFRAGTGDLTARIDAEKSSGQIGADLLWAADAPTLEAYKEGGDLAQLDNVDTSHLIEEARHEGNFYVGTRIIPTVIAYNTDVLGQDELPKSWQDLTDEKFANRVVLPDPSVSGAAAYNATVWANNDQLGTAWVKALGANHPMIAASNGPASQEVAGGGHPVGIMVDYLVRDLAESGSPIATIYPEEGAPFITEPIGIFASSANKDAAAKYISFLLSEKGQKLAVDQNYLPVIDSVGTPAGTPKLSDISLMEAELETLTSERSASVSAFQNAMK